MRLALPLAICVAAVLAAGSAARAETAYTLDKIEIHGVNSVPTAQLAAGLNNHPGDKVTTNDLLADQDALTKELEAQHVGGSVKTSLRNKQNGHIDLIFDVDDQGVQAPKVVTVAPKLGVQSFVGNVKMKSEDLAAASGLKPDDDLSDAKVQAAEAAIGDAYKKAKIGVNLTGAIKQSGGKADLIWTIVEQKAPPKEKRKDDSGYDGN